MTQSVTELGLPTPKERRRLREAADLTHDEVAAAVGVTPNTVRSWETGRTHPRGRKLEAYSKLLARLSANESAGPAPSGPTARTDGSAPPDGRATGAAVDASAVAASDVAVSDFAVSDVAASDVAASAATGPAGADTDAASAPGTVPGSPLDSDTERAEAATGADPADADAASAADAPESLFGLRMMRGLTRPAGAQTRPKAAVKRAAKPPVGMPRHEAKSTVRAGAALGGSGHGGSGFAARRPGGPVPPGTGTGAGTATGTAPDTGSGTGPDSEPRSGRTAAPSTRPGTGNPAGRDSEAATRTSTTGPGSGPHTGTDTGTHTGTDTGSESQPATGAGPTGPGSGPGSGPAAGQAPGEATAPGSAPAGKDAGPAAPEGDPGAAGGSAVEARTAPADAPEDAPGNGAPTVTATSAFAALYDRTAPALSRQAYLLTGRHALACEAVEHAFQQAWERWPEVATDPDPVGWVRSATYEYALSPWHRFRRSHRHPDKPPADPADRVLLDAMLGLPPAHRRTVLLYDGVGLDLPDTAAETEASTPTAGRRLVNAHADLADQLPELDGVAPAKQSAVLRERLGTLAPPLPLEPRAAAVVRVAGEHRTRLWTRAVIGVTAAIAAATTYTAVTAPTEYEPPRAPGASVSGVPPHSGPQQLTDEGRQLHDKLVSDPSAGPSRISPSLE